MTNKSLSQQICEECGIEPKYWCSYHSCICPIQDIGKFNPKCPKQSVTKECDTRSHEPRYPDFENNNNNFVKLLELKILTGCTLWGFLSLKGVYMSQKETVLKTIYLILSNKIKFLGDKSREQIKQAIREEKWEEI